MIETMTDMVTKTVPIGIGEDGGTMTATCRNLLGYTEKRVASLMME